LIYISSSCIKAKKIADSVVQLADEGFTNIELSGGTENYPELERDLVSLKTEYGLNYLCHNYFPPPEKHFVLNLASLDDELYARSVEFYKKTLKLSSRLGADKFGLHAGFLFNPCEKQLGKTFDEDTLYDSGIATDRFNNAFKELSEYSKRLDIALFVENNVLSEANYRMFNNIPPFLFCDSSGLNELVSNCSVLLDVAHLKVSTKTLGRNFIEELEMLLPISNYIHVSDNDGQSDSNNCLEKNNNLYHSLRENSNSLKNKDFTIEVYDGLDAVKTTYDNIRELINE